MNNMEAVALTKSVFDAILTSKTVDEVDKIVDSDKALKKNEFSSSIYPDLAVTLTPDEIEQLKERGVLTPEGELAHGLEPDELNPLEKLLYSVLWKNRDLGKERHVVEGVLATGQGSGDPQKEDGLVFYQFGKHLADRQEPIIDKHTIRAFKLFKYEGEVESDSVKKIRKKDALDARDLPSIKQYEDWLATIESDDAKFQFHIDKVLYALGKAIKIKKTTKKAEPES